MKKEQTNNLGVGLGGNKYIIVEMFKMHWMGLEDKVTKLISQ